MCPLSNLIHLLDSFEIFKDYTKTKVTEYESCRRRFNTYMHLMGDSKNGHLKKCIYYDDHDSESYYCDCDDYMYRTPLLLAQEIVDIIAIAYIINFTHPKAAVFEDWFCDKCSI